MFFPLSYMSICKFSHCHPWGCGKTPTGAHGVLVVFFLSEPVRWRCGWLVFTTFQRPLICYHPNVAWYLSGHNVTTVIPFQNYCASSVSDDSDVELPPWDVLIRNACMMDFWACFVARSSEPLMGHLRVLLGISSYTVFRIVRPHLKSPTRPN